MIALFLACTRDSPAPERPGPAEVPTGDTAADRPAVPDLTEAPDLDPDPDIVHVSLRAAPATLATDEGPRAVWAYEGTVPGPTIRAKLGDRVVVALENALPVDTTVHWHGLEVPYAMDGVTWQLAPIPPGGAFTYTFDVAQAGTFWYHPHFDTEGQVDRGLYGLVVVEDPADPPVDAEVAWVFDVWGEHDETDEAHGFAPLAGPWRVNGAVDPVAAFGDQTVRVRALNASNLGYLQVKGPGLRAVGGDQGLLAAESAEPVLLAPGDRAEWTVTGEAFDVDTTSWSMAGPSALGPDVRLLSVDGGLPLAWQGSGALPTPDPGTTDVVWVFAGDPHTDTWLVNGAAYPDVPVEEIPLGAPAILEVRNLSPTEHPFHLHGLVFEVLSVDGVAPPYARFEDTVNVGIRQTVRLRVEADNPGDWMAHCHLLPHAEGMMAVLRVE